MCEQFEQQKYATRISIRYFSRFLEMFLSSLIRVILQLPINKRISSKDCGFVADLSGLVGRQSGLASGH